METEPYNDGDVHRARMRRSLRRVSRALAAWPLETEDVWRETVLDERKRKKREAEGNRKNSLRLKLDLKIQVGEKVRRKDN